MRQAVVALASAAATSTATDSHRHHHHRMCCVSNSLATHFSTTYYSYFGTKINKLGSCSHLAGKLFHVTFSNQTDTRDRTTLGGVGRQVGGYNIKTSPDKTNYTPPVSQVFTVCRAALYVTRPILSRDQLKLPELNGEFRAAGRQASKATHVSNPDCFAPSVSVSLRPAIQHSAHLMQSAIRKQLAGWKTSR